MVDDVLRLEVVADRAVAPVDERHPSSGTGWTQPNRSGIRSSCIPVSSSYKRRVTGPMVLESVP